MKKKHIKLINCSPSFVVGLLLSALGSISGILIPLEIRKFVDSGRVSQKLDFALLLPIVELFILQALLQIFSEIIIYNNGEKRIFNLRKNINWHILRLPMTFFNDENSSEIAGHLINDTNTIKEFITIEYISFFSGIITIVGTVIAIFSLDWKLSLMLIIVFPLMALVVVPLGNIGGKYAQNIQRLINKLIGIASENYQHIKLIKLNVSERATSNLYNTKLDKLYKQSVKSDIVQAIVSPLGLIFLFAAIGIIFSYGGYRVANGTLSVGTLMSFLIYIFQLLNPIGQFADFFTEYKKARGAMEKLDSIENTQIESDKKTDQSSLYLENIYLKDVSFSYANKIVLNNINMVIPALNKVAIAGPSGSGKSTIISLIDRLYNPSNGKILLGKKDISTFSLYDWRSMFSIVSQENEIISGTIKDNLLFGLNYIPTNDELLDALKQADLKDCVFSLPEQINTFVGEDGVKLSGGQRQRLQIARVYLRNTPFIIMDEATSNLDPDSEKVVMNAINEFRGSKTLIIIAHRLSTIKDSDIIYFLEDRHITGYGKHEELIKNNSSYRRFVQEQMSK